MTIAVFVCIPIINRAPIILSLDTATQTTSVAVTSVSRVLAQCSAATEAAHVARLLGCVDQVLRESGITLKDINVLAATIGPGSFTGLRTGLATIKAFAATLNIPIAAIPTLHAIAIAEGAPQKRIAALLPAGRKEVYVQLLSFDDSLDVVELSSARHVTPDKMLDEILCAETSIMLVGDGARSCITQLQARSTELGVRFITNDESESRAEFNGWQVAAASKMPLAASVAQVALRLAIQRKLIAADDLHAMYVRPSDVELKLLAL